jgi:hypothetical protein
MNRKELPKAACDQRVASPPRRPGSTDRPAARSDPPSTVARDDNQCQRKRGLASALIDSSLWKRSSWPIWRNRSATESNEP